MIRKMDKLGRITIPVEWTRHAGIKRDKEVVMHYNEETKEISIKRYTVVGECAFCGEDNPMSLCNFKNNILCYQCIEDIKKSE